MRNGLLRLPTLVAGLVAAAAVIAGCGGTTSSPRGANAADRAFVQHMMAVQTAQTAGGRAITPRSRR